MKKKIIKKHISEKYELSHPPYYTEGYWEEDLEYWENYQPSGNIGKWWVTIQIEKLKNKIKSAK
jgi:hypothetical protein